MSPIPERGRVTEYARKGLELGLRQAALAPEQRAARRLRADLVAPSGEGQRVALLSPRDWSYHVQVEAIIAQALRARGAEVWVVGCGGGLEICDRVNTWEGPPLPCRSCTHYVASSVRAHGLPFTTIEVSDRRPEPNDWPELDAMDEAELAAVEVEGLPLGRLVMTPVRWFLMSATLGEDPLGQLTTRRFLRSGRRVARHLAKVLDDLRPTSVLLLNGRFFFESIAWELCRQRGIDVITYERGFRLQTLVFRRDVAASQYDISHVWSVVSGRPLAAGEEARLDEYLAGRRRGGADLAALWPRLREETVARSRRRRVVLFTNITWDSAVIGQEAGFESIQAWLSAAIELFSRRAEDELIIRIHPAEMRLPGKKTREPLAAFITARWPVLPENITLIEADNTASSYSLMDSCDLGLVYTSTTGLELALAGKPVIVAGKTHYMGKGFSIDVTSPGDFRFQVERVLSEPSAFAPDPELVRRYAYAFFFRAVVPIPFVTEPVPGLVRVDLARDELTPGANQALDRICEGIMRGGLFLEPSDVAAVG